MLHLMIDPSNLYTHSVPHCEFKVTNSLSQKMEVTINLRSRDVVRIAICFSNKCLASCNHTTISEPVMRSLESAANSI